MFPNEFLLRRKFSVAAENRLGPQISYIVQVAPETVGGDGQKNGRKSPVCCCNIEKKEEESGKLLILVDVWYIFQKAKLFHISSMLNTNRCFFSNQINLIPDFHCPCRNIPITRVSHYTNRDFHFFLSGQGFKLPDLYENFECHHILPDERQIFKL